MWEPKIKSMNLILFPKYVFLFGSDKFAFYNLPLHNSRTRDLHKLLKTFRYK